MIAEWFLSMGIFIFKALTFFIPSSDITNPENAEAIKYILEESYKLNNILPVETILSVLFALITIEGVILIFKLIFWIKNNSGLLKKL